MRFNIITPLLLHFALCSFAMAAPSVPPGDIFAGAGEESSGTGGSGDSSGTTESDDSDCD